MTVSLDRCTVIEMTSEITNEKNEDFKKLNKGNALDTLILDFFPLQVCEIPLKIAINS